MYTADRKKWSISALAILSLCSSVEDSLLECLRANISKRSPTFDLVSKPRSGKYLQFRKKSLFTTVLITNNGRLDQRPGLKTIFWNIFWKWCPHFALSYHGYTTPPRTKDTTCTVLHLCEGQRVWYIEFGALQLACTSDLSKRPQNKNKSWQEIFVLFAFTNKSNKTFLAIYGMIVMWIFRLISIISLRMRTVRTNA